MSRLKKTSPTILLMAVILFLGIGYSIYKAANSFSVEVDSPAYDRTPSDAIVAPELETVIPQNDPVAIRSEREGFRLPDRALFDISDGSLEIADALAKDEFTAPFLLELGYPGTDAEAVARKVEGFYNEGRIPGAESENKVAIQNESSGVLFAQSSLEVQFTGEGGENSSLSIYIGWSPQGDSWVPVAFSESSL